MKLRWLIFGARETARHRNQQAESWVCGIELMQVISPLPQQHGYGINTSAKTHLVPYLPAKHGIRRSSLVFAGLQNSPFSIKSNLRETWFAYRFSTCVLPFLHSRPHWYSAFAAIARLVPGVSGMIPDCSGETDGRIKPAVW